MKIISIRIALILATVFTFGCASMPSINFDAIPGVSLMPDFEDLEKGVNDVKKRIRMVASSGYNQLAPIIKPALKNFNPATAFTKQPSAVVKSTVSIFNQPTATVSVATVSVGGNGLSANGNFSGRMPCGTGKGKPVVLPWNRTLTKIPGFGSIPQKACDKEYGPMAVKLALRKISRMSDRAKRSNSGAMDLLREMDLVPLYHYGYPSRGGAKYSKIPKDYSFSGPSFASNSKTIANKAYKTPVVTKKASGSRITKSNPVVTKSSGYKTSSQAPFGTMCLPNPANFEKWKKMTPRSKKRYSSRVSSNVKRGKELNPNCVLTAGEKIIIDHKNNPNAFVGMD